MCGISLDIGDIKFCRIRKGRTNRATSDDCCGLRARLAQLLIHLMNQAALLQCSSNQFEFC
jgi:hypothetical protein